MICADAQLSDLDGQVGQLYRDDLGKLSPVGAQRLKDGERAWLVYLGQACPTASAQLDFQGKLCLMRAYRDRVADLKAAAVRSGPFLFTRIDTYSTEKPSAQDEEDEGGPPRAPELGLKHIAAPQIDGPITSVTTDWNKLAMRSGTESDCDGSDGDISLNYSLGLATSHLISVTWRTWWYCHGTPHGNGDSRVQNVILTPKPRPLEAGDLFLSGKPWKEKLEALLLAEVEKAARDADVDPERLDRAAVAEVAASPARWSLREAGLAVEFDPYELGEGYPFAPDVTVPWSALSDLLVGDPTRP